MKVFKSMQSATCIRKLGDILILLRLTLLFDEDLSYLNECFQKNEIY